MYSNHCNSENPFELGQRAEFGTGVAKDISAAAGYYLQAAEEGNADAMCHIGYLMLFGFGVQRSTSVAISWMEKGLSTPGEDSIYRKNAAALLEKIKKAPYSFKHEETRFPAFMDSFNEYNRFAEEKGYKTLTFKDGVVSGTAVDDESSYYVNKLPQKEHYLNFSRVNPENVKSGFWSNFKQEFYQGFLGGRFIYLVREMIALGID